MLNEEIKNAGFALTSNVSPMYELATTIDLLLKKAPHITLIDPNKNLDTTLLVYFLNTRITFLFAGVSW